MGISRMEFWKIKLKKLKIWKDYFKKMKFQKIKFKKLEIWKIGISRMEFRKIKLKNEILEDYFENRNFWKIGILENYF